MPRILAAAFACAILFLAGAANAEPIAPKDYISPVAHLGGDSDGFCTAFYVGHGLFLTAGHCAKDKPSPIKIVFQGGRRADADLIAISSPFQNMPDFAILEMKSDLAKKITPFNLNCDYQPKIGEELRIEGFPSNMGFTVVWGRVSHELRPWTVAWKKPVFGINISATGGNSGSPVIDELSGGVVGILVGGNPQNQTLAVAQPLTDVCKLVRP